MVNITKPGRQTTRFHHAAALFFARRCVLATVFMLAAMSLSACADTPWPTWLTGEPGADVVTKPRAVIEPPSKGSPVWPNLADVPEKPVKPFSSNEANASLLQGMKRDRADAETARQRLDSVPTPALLSPQPSE